MTTEPRFDHLEPVPLILHCPACGARHIDRGDFAKKPHHTHACQGCGLTWRPSTVDTVGVAFLPGFHDADTLDGEELETLARSYGIDDLRGFAYLDDLRAEIRHRAELAASGCNDPAPPRGVALQRKPTVTTHVEKDPAPSLMLAGLTKRPDGLADLTFVRGELTAKISACYPSELVREDGVVTKIEASTQPHDASAFFGIGEAEGFHVEVCDGRVVYTFDRRLRGFDALVDWAEAFEGEKFDRVKKAEPPRDDVTPAPESYLVTVGGIGEEHEVYADATGYTLRQTLINAARDNNTVDVNAWRLVPCSVTFEQEGSARLKVKIATPAEIELVRVTDLRQGHIIILDDGSRVVVKGTDHEGCSKAKMRIRLRGRPPIIVDRYYQPTVRRLRDLD